MTIRFAPFVIVAAAALGSLLVAGCGSGAGPDPKQQEKSVENAQNLRSYFDKVGGEYDSLTEADKAAYIRLSGDEEKARRNWDLMKNGPGAVDRSGQTAPTGGGTGQ